MPRIVSVWLPAWPMDRLARASRISRLPSPWAGENGHDKPFALIESGTKGLRLTAVNARAWQDGLRPGQTLADARAALPAIGSAPAEPEKDRAALTALALWAGRYGPSRNVEGRDGLWIDTSGVAHLYGGEARMLDDLIARLAQVGIAARAGLADTAGAAFALARFAACRKSPIAIAAPGTACEALAPVSVAALRLSADEIVLLQRLGLSRIGQLYGLPREALAQRFRSPPAGRSGTRSVRRERQAVLMAGIVLARLDQALGHVPDPREPLVEPPRHLARRLFPEPLISGAGVAAALEALAHDLALQLEARIEGGTRFGLELYRADGSAQQLRIGASRPCRDPHHLIALFAEKLDTLDAGFGIDAMTLTCTQAEPLAETQIAIYGTADTAREAAASALVDRLSNRLGAARVLRLVPVDSHIPERAQRRSPMLAANASSMTDEPPNAQHRARHHARPSLLLPVPEPIAVLAEVPEGPPLRFSWRRLNHRIVRAQGPERIEPEWWRAIGRPPSRTGTPQMIHLSRPRDYYVIEDDTGGRYWVFRAGLYGREEDTETRLRDGEDSEDTARKTANPVWFMHGVLG